MEPANQHAAAARLRARPVVAEFARALWHLRAVIIALNFMFLLLALAMYYLGGPVDTATRTPSPLGETLYFCAVTALTIGYGDVVPTTSIGRIVAVLLGVAGVAAMGVVTAVAVHAVQTAARRAGVRR